MNRTPNYSRALAWIALAAAVVAVWTAAIAPALRHGAATRAAAERTLDR